MILDLLDALARVNLAIGAAVLVVLLVRKPSRRAFGARSAYLLWIVPLLAGLAALGPPLALGPATPAPLAAPAAMEAVVEVVAVAADTAVSRAPSLPVVLAVLWGLGGLAAAALLLSRQARFVSALGRLTPMAPRIYRAERPGTGPAVIGAFFPRIVAPADFEARFGPQEREVVLAHERAHLARGDAAANAAAAAMLCLCWFNPLVHVAVWLMRLDQELACDAAVLSRFPEKRRLYAEVLLKTQLASQALPFGCCWPPASEHPLKERIVMLKAPLPVTARRLAGAGFVTLLAAAAAGAAAWAAQPGQPKVALAPGAAPSAADDRPCSAAETRLYNCKDDAGPTWLAQPTLDEVMAVYPKDALNAGASGKAILNCLVDPASGRMQDCIAVRYVNVGPRKPAQYDFERPALKLGPLYRVDTASLPKNAKGEYPRMQIAVLFMAPGADPAVVGARALPRTATAVATDASAAEPAARATPTQAAAPATVATAATAPVLPEWIDKPDGLDVARVYPAAASAAKLEGRATLECGVDGEGRLTHCKVASEAPAAAGFGEAALQLAAEFRMKEKDRNGVNTNGGMVRIPFRFTTPSS
ncbi:MAG: TonB family protein [Phenylobacterium sp.]|uniref:TonB family protein n=1 Tax=Phenylobacterium sp. TaxID=1871053 RepID=UPI001A632560|nr:TonB family protein [Phenylobacterium sp.]MBL8555951.1 TonB family protein [Phenylobacterium sp.]